eukprot:TRINITY_DN10683_c0_g1_i2.p1 TRINITY_DN10683_c0_g1~~TRINITY_DN10683_c0_g1_i2.p1  ORF type:complete len:342 (+),score=76.45 TRINITY_DN10683_c0_g1_i2:493-1518(+)
MTDTACGMAAPGKGEPLEEFRYDLPSLGLRDIEIKVQHCGVCASDVHLIDGEWGDMAQYPHVAGHEVVGKISAIGKDVTLDVQEGDLVGVGWWKKACGHCIACVEGDEQICRKSVGSCLGEERGGFSNRFRAHESAVFKLPEGLEPAVVAPLLCGGITVYTPLAEYTRPGDRVGILGIGGLGHIALQFANARGCHVTAFSTSPDKEKEAKQLGAHEFVNSKDDNVFSTKAQSLDLLLVTANVSLDWNKFLQLLRPRGVLAFVGAIPEPAKLEIFGPMIMNMLKVVGSATGGRARTEEMLEFAAMHNIKPKIERVPLKDANKALDKVRNGEARYRMVLDVSV